jgi:hypothetical protein
MKNDPAIELERAAIALAANFVDLLGRTTASAWIFKIPRMEPRRVLQRPATVYYSSSEF